ncbi:hypothetical protein [Phytohabitans rumicis]|uniref:Uncharacterized protein n=1 Tax=Phytohabitans rumicis TaxID=1076125 RepID=A0A6V8L3I1_9ACTN|nr:hypothetical protein [Phytohabitans rumicis]GFJ88637.1 hypothetical protein Prum_022790 [Phytohabitans rumicis]
MDTDDQAAWRERRRLAVAAHAAADERRRAAEAAEARQLVDDFVRRARAAGVPTAALVARAYTGRARYRTGLHGWYLKADRSMAVAADGSFYLLSVAPSFWARFTGVTLVPQDPPLVVGRGGKDGESIPLTVLLDRALS